MNGLLDNFVDNTIQCWSCSIFDQLFTVISKAAAAVYDKLAYFCIILFCVIFAFFVLNAVWQNIKNGAKDSWYDKSIQRVFINAVFVISILSMGVMIPRFVTQITFEPVAKITLIYEENILKQTEEDVNRRVNYVPIKIQDSDEYFFRPQLRDTIIQIAKTTITQFQSFMKLGLAIIDEALTWNLLHFIAHLFKHLFLIFAGAYLFWNFFKLFFRFLCYFADVIVAMMFFAFFFPLSLVMMIFKGAENVPSWVSNIGKGMGADQIKKLISAIVSLAAAVITYTVIMVIIARFFSGIGTSTEEIMAAITSGQIFESDLLDDDNIANFTIMGTIVLVYVLGFIYSQIPQVTNKIMEAFNIKLEKSEIGEKVADDVMGLTKAIWDTGKQIGKTIINGGEKGTTK